MLQFVMHYLTTTMLNIQNIDYWTMMRIPVLLLVMQQEVQHHEVLPFAPLQFSK